MIFREREPETESEAVRRERAQFAGLVQAMDHAASLVEYWPLTGGVSAQTTALEIDEAGGRRRRLVVRMHGQSDLARDPDIAQHEYQLLAALNDAGLPVPAPVYVHQAGVIFERPAVVMEFIDGEIVTDPASPAQFIAELARWLARIHSVDLTSADLSFLVAKDFQSADRLEARSDDSPLVRQMCQELREYGPVALTNAPVLMHGDFWPGNLLWNGGELAAIVDWEDAMIGDPIIDLARSRMEFHLAHGQMARERFTSHYLSYRDINVDSLAYWDLALALGFARALPGWGLADEREQEMRTALADFVEQARRQLALTAASLALPPEGGRGSPD